MPVYVLLLIAVAPVLAMVAATGDALGHDAYNAALMALVVTLSILAAWLVREAVRNVIGIWRRVMSQPYT